MHALRSGKAGTCRQIWWPTHVDFDSPSNPPNSCSLIQVYFICHSSRKSPIISLCIVCQWLILFTTYCAGCSHFVAIFLIHANMYSSMCMYVQLKTKIQKNMFQNWISVNLPTLHVDLSMKFSMWSSHYSLDYTSKQKPLIWVYTLKTYLLLHPT